MKGEEEREEQKRQKKRGQSAKETYKINSPNLSPISCKWNQMTVVSKCVVFAGYLVVCLIGLHCIKSNWLFVLLGLVCSSAHNELTTCISTSKLYCLSSLAKATRSVATLAACVPTLFSSLSHAMGHLCCALLLSVWVCCIRTFHAANDVFICHVSSPHTQPVSLSCSQSLRQPVVLNSVSSSVVSVFQLPANEAPLFGDSRSVRAAG